MTQTRKLTMLTSYKLVMTLFCMKRFFSNIRGYPTYWRMVPNSATVGPTNTFTFLITIQSFSCPLKPRKRVYIIQ